MYRKIYRQEGGLAEEGYRAQISQAREKAIEDWNRRTRGEVAERVRPRPRRAYRPANMPVDTERQQGLAGIQQKRLEQGVDYIGGSPLSIGPDVGKYIIEKVLPQIKKFTKGPELEEGKDYEGRSPLSIPGLPEIARPVIDYAQAWLGPDANIYDTFNIPSMTPEMVTNIKDILKKQGGFKGVIRPEDFGFPKGDFPEHHKIPSTREEWKNVLDAGPAAWGNYFRLGNIPWTLDPTTGKYSFTGTEFDFPTEGTRVEHFGDFITSGGLTGLLNRMQAKERGEEVDPETQRPYKVDIPDIYNKDLQDILKYDIGEAQREAERRRLEQAVERPKSEYYTRWTPEQLTGPFWSAGQSYGTPEAWSKSPKMVPPGLDAHDRVFVNRVNYERDFRNKKIAEIQAQNYSPEREAELIRSQKRQIELIEDLVNRQTSDFNTQRNWAYGQLNLPVPTQPYTPTGFEGTGYGQFSPQAAGGVYRPTGNIGLRPAGTTPTTINTRPYQPLAAY